MSEERELTYKDLQNFLEWARKVGKGEFVFKSITIDEEDDEVVNYKDSRCFYRIDKKDE